MLRQHAFGSKLAQIQASYDGGQGAGGGGGGPELPENQKKTKPLSKRLSTAISQCSSKMTDVLAWQSKIKENKTGLNLG